MRTARFAAVFLAGAAIYWLSQWTELSVYVTNMASMIGIGVAVDYSLFIVSRFRRELHEGVEEGEALRRSLASSGTAVGISADLATDNDARRLARAGVPVRQISTGTVCHLDAKMVGDALADWDLRALDFLFVENVGNLVCPASYDLGEQLRVVLLAVTEGEDKPLKYPTIFHSADLAVITKSDLADAVDFDRAAAHANMRSVAPEIEVLETSARTRDGLDRWLDRLTQGARG